MGDIKKLGFHWNIAREAISEDGILTIMAPGLGMTAVLDVIIRSFLGRNSKDVEQSETTSEFTSSGHMLAILGCNEEQRMQLCSSNSRVKEITNEVAAQERSKRYEDREPSVYAVTSRIFVVDLLQHRIDSRWIAGLVFVNAHRISETSTEALIAYLYRKNRSAADPGSVGAITDNPARIGSVFTTVERIAKTLTLGKVQLWPRFQVDIARALDDKPAQVIEVHQQLSDNMKDIQNALITVVGACVSELRRSTAVELNDISVEDLLFKPLDDVIQRQLDSVWHITPKKTKQLVYDLRTLRNLAQMLVSLDAVSFLHIVETQRAAESIRSVWMYVKGADEIFEASKRRVYVMKTKPKSSGKKRLHNENPQSSRELVSVLEPLPKWELLLDVLEDIRGETASNTINSVQGAEENQSSETGNKPSPVSELPCVLGGANCANAEESKGDSTAREGSHQDGQNDDSKTDLNLVSKGGYQTKSSVGVVTNSSPAKVLIVCKEERTRTEIAIILKHNISTLMQYHFQRYLHERGKTPQSSENPKSGNAQNSARFKRRKDRKNERSSDQVGKRKDEEDKAEAAAVATVAAGEKECDIFSGAADKHEGLTIAGGLVNVHIISLNKALISPLLEDIKPEYIILYEADLATIREIESLVLGVFRKPDRAIQQVFTATLPRTVPSPRVYFLIYQNSLEEQKYISSVNRERQAFESLIREKQGMVLNMSKTLPSLHQPLISSELTNASTRKAGGTISRIGQRKDIIVDIREFMSSLPIVLHLSGMRVVPVTLEVGDYVLSPNMCVERKGLADLQQSLLSGRLYNQADAMCKNYDISVLLIEFNAEKSFSLQSVSDLSEEISSTSLLSKIILLTLHFPRLRLLWSRSLHSTLSLFSTLKENQDEPNSTTAASVGLTKGSDAVGTRQDGYDDMETNQVGIDILNKMPGVNSSNLSALMASAGSLAGLCTMTQQEMRTAMKSEANAKALYTFLHAKCPPLQSI